LYKKEFGNLRQITADFESTLTKDCASLRKVPQDSARLRHLARKTHRSNSYRMLSWKKEVAKIFFREMAKLGLSF
jgi:hypothetical protein